MPESLPGYIKITSYALSADATNTAETKKTEYSIYVKTKKISKFEMSADFKAGKEKALGALFGAAMKELRGAGDPAVIKELLENKLK